MGWTINQGQQWVPGHLLKQLYLRGGQMTKDIDRYLVTQSN